MHRQVYRLRRIVSMGTSDSNKTQSLNEHGQEQLPMCGFSPAVAFPQASKAPCLDWRQGRLRATEARINPGATVLVLVLMK